MTTRRAALGGALAATGAALFGRPAKARLLPGKPFAGQRVAVLVPHASQFRAQEKRFAEFTAATGIEVAYNYVPYAQLRDKITTEAVAGSDAFDLYCWLDAWGPSLALYLEPLDALLARDGIAMDRYPQAYRQGASFGGTVLGLPIRGHPQLLFYRKDLLAKAGVEPPRTWDELVSVADAVQRKTGVAGVAMYYGKGNAQQNLFLWLNFLWGRGGDLFTPDFQRTRFAEPEAVEATRAYLDLHLKHKVTAPGSVQFVEQDAVNSVAQGNAAMVMVWWWVWSVLTGSKSTLEAEQVGFAPMPQTAGGPRVSYAISLPFGIAKASRRKEAAFEFLKWVSSPELEIACATDKSDPNTADIVVTHRASFLDPRVNAANVGLHRVAAESLEGSRIMPQLEVWPQIAVVLESTISELATGTKPVEAGLAEAAREADRILKRAGVRKG